MRALRIDVCTSDGLRQGVPALLGMLKRLDIRATFFVSMGPDHSGLAVLRVFRRRGFLGKMLRTGAPKMYGLRTMLSGTLLPATLTGLAQGDILRRIADDGHELGIHGWDHVLWHDHLPKMSRTAIQRHLSRAVEAYESILKRPPPCTAAPAWVCSPDSLEVQEAFGFAFASDTRGSRPFYPSVRGRTLHVPQIPVTAPTLDEILGGVSDANAEILSRWGDGGVHTMHAEAEGRAYLQMAERLLHGAGPVGPLGRLVPLATGASEIVHREIPGRAGAVSLQGS